MRGIVDMWNEVMIPKLPDPAPLRALKRSGRLVSETVAISPLGRTISKEITLSHASP